jgi:hypothetical protein
MTPRASWRVVPTLVVALGAYAWRSVDAGAQRAWIADVSVRAIELTPLTDGGSRIARIVIAADSSRASAVRVEVMLPVGVGVLHLADGCRASPGPVTSLSARVTCALGDMTVRESRSVFVTTAGRPASSRPRFAAFAFSDTPDPVPSNNYAERIVP